MKTSSLHSFNKVYAFFILLFSIVACNDFNYESIKGNGDVVTKSKFLASDFDALSIAGSYNITIVPSKRDSIIITAESNIIPYVLVERRGDLLIIKNAPNTNLRTTEPIKITLFPANISDIDLSGSGSIIADSINSADIKLSIAGSGSILAGLVAKNLDISIAGSGDVIVNGNATNTVII